MTAENETVTAAAGGRLTMGGDMTVNRMGFGAMRVTGGGVWGPPPDREESIRVLKTAVRLDVDFFDTANSYGPHVSEELIAEALYPYPEGLVIATKGGLTRPGPGKWVPNGRPEHLRQELEGSLRRLRLERIDLYQFHRPDPEVPIEESLGELADMQRKGLIRHVGVSNFTVDQIQRGQQIVPIVSVQNRYNLTDREWEPVLDYCQEEGIAFLPWGPLGQGPMLREGGLLAEVAAAHDATPAQVALAWLLQRSLVTLVIPGTSSVAHLYENVAAAEIELSEEEFGALDRLAGGGY